MRRIHRGHTALPPQLAAGGPFRAGAGLAARLQLRKAVHDAGPRLARRGPRAGAGGGMDRPARPGASAQPCRHPPRGNPRTGRHRLGGRVRHDLCLPGCPVRRHPRPAEHPGAAGCAAGALARREPARAHTPAPGPAAAGRAAAGSDLLAGPGGNNGPAHLGTLDRPPK